MTVYVIQLGIGPYGSNMTEFIVWGSDELNALENLYSEYHDAYPKYFRSADSFEEDVRRTFKNGGWSSLDEVREAFEEDETYLDVDGGQYIGTIYSIKEADEIYQFLDYHNLKPEDPTNSNSVIYDAYGDALMECPKCGAITTFSRGFDEYDFGNGVEWECRTCGSLGDPDYVRLKEGYKIVNNYMPGLLNPKSKVKSRAIKPKFKRGCRR